MAMIAEIEKNSGVKNFINCQTFHKVWKGSGMERIEKLKMGGKCQKVSDFFESLM